MRKNVDFISSSITTSSSNSDLTSTKKMSKQLKTAVTCSCFLAIVSSKLYFVNLYFQSSTYSQITNKQKHLSTKSIKSYDYLQNICGWYKYSFRNTFQRELIQFWSFEAEII